MDLPANTAENGEAIQLRNCSKGYEISNWKCWGRPARHTVFTDLNLTVPVGKTYALLGPSGCGKTTLLKCIMGRLQMDSGDVRIFGSQLGSGHTVTGSDIGYMPQETALFTLLTIEETLEYYGKLVGLSNAFRKSQIKFFVDYLKLPPKGTVNHKLSGGQLRRLSFAVAAIHEPKLLIMDEPTVGVDPIVRQRMWCYLRYIMQHFSTTIIITTHYIEEARTADVVGLLQNGCMLAEGAPNSLMDKWNVASLEDLFFKIYSKHLEQDSTGNKQSHDCSPKPVNGQNQTQDDIFYTRDIDQKITESRPNQGHQKDANFLKISRLAAIGKKNFISLFRFPFALVFLICLPAAQLILSYIALSDLTDLKIGVHNEDAGSLGDMYLAALDSKTIQQIQYKSYQDGYQDVHDGKLLSFIYISHNFTDIYTKRFVEVDSLNANYLSGGLIDVTIDTTELALAPMLKFQLATAFKKLSSTALTEAGLSPSLAKPFLQVNFLPKELISFTFQVTMMPSQLIMFMYVIQVGASLLFLFLEKTSGYLERSLVCGVTFFEIILGFAIIQFAIALVQAFGLLVAAFLICKSPLVGSATLTAVFAVLSGLSGMSLGLFVSAWLDQLLIIATIGLAVIFAMPALCGESVEVVTFTHRSEPPLTITTSFLPQGLVTRRVVFTPLPRRTVMSGMMTRRDDRDTHRTTPTTSDAQDSSQPSSCLSSPNNARLMVSRSPRAPRRRDWGAPLPTCNDHGYNTHASSGDRLDGNRRGSSSRGDYTDHYTPEGFRAYYRSPPSKRQRREGWERSPRTVRVTSTAERYSSPSVGRPSPGVVQHSSFPAAARVPSATSTSQRSPAEGHLTFQNTIRLSAAATGRHWSPSEGQRTYPAPPSFLSAAAEQPPSPPDGRRGVTHATSQPGVGTSGPPESLTVPSPTPTTEWGGSSHQGLYGEPQENTVQIPETDQQPGVQDLPLCNPDTLRKWLDQLALSVNLQQHGITLGQPVLPHTLPSAPGEAVVAVEEIDTGADDSTDLLVLDTSLIDVGGSTPPSGGSPQPQTRGGVTSQAVNVEEHDDWGFRVSTPLAALSPPTVTAVSEPVTLRAATPGQAELVTLDLTPDITPAAAIPVVALPRLPSRKNHRRRERSTKDKTTKRPTN